MLSLPLTDTVLANEPVNIVKSRWFHTHLILMLYVLCIIITSAKVVKFSFGFYLHKLTNLVDYRFL